MNFKEIPQTWLVAGLGVSLVTLRYFGIDTWTTAALSSLSGYILGRHIAQNQQKTPSDLGITNVSLPVQV